jgi:hypothetical protein
VISDPKFDKKEYYEAQKITKKPIDAIVGKKLWQHCHGGH